MKQEYDFSKGARGKFFREGAKPHFPVSWDKPEWAGPSGQIGQLIRREAENSLEAYRVQPKLAAEHAHSEKDTAQGGYAHRQLFELVQNGADALLESARVPSILVRLTDRFLYCADGGKPIDKRGVEGLMFDRLSSKRNSAAIGRFGRGFKSILRVTDSPEFYSRSGSFRFDKVRAEERIRKVASADHYPVLRLPEPIDPLGEGRKDEELRELMGWATNIVRLPLRAGAYDDLAKQIRDFPAEFLLFVEHVLYLTLECGENSRSFQLHRRDGELQLDSGEGTSRWLRSDTTHRLSAEAQADWHLIDAGHEIPISWAAPLEGLDQPGHFWAFFPTDTASLVAGILNAPWKTNEDRQNLLPGPYNEELIKAAAELIAKTLCKFSTNEDPARHLDALPRRHESGDSKQADLLREELFSSLDERNVVPDQDGILRSIGEISYPPMKLIDHSDKRPVRQWAAYTGRPRDWLHLSALTRRRLATIDRLFASSGLGDKSVPKASIAFWLESLVKGQDRDEIVRASMAAVQIAAAIPDGAKFWDTPLGCDWQNHRFGNVVLTACGDLKPPDPEFLILPEQPQSGVSNPELCVHPELVADRNTLKALKALGLEPPSPMRTFIGVANSILKGSKSRASDIPLQEFWHTSRNVAKDIAKDIIQNHEDWERKIYVRTRAGTWRSLCAVLLPGEVLPGDGSRDEDATVDIDFHRPDEILLRELGVTAVPQDGRELSSEEDYAPFKNLMKGRYSNQDNLPHSPHRSHLGFLSKKGVGPLEVLKTLSDEGRSIYTEALLSHDGTYRNWTMKHTREIYPEMTVESLTIHVLREHGRIQTSNGFVSFKDALGSTPRSTQALHVLLNHPKADKIKERFDLADPTPEFLGEADPVPLTDVWPGLKEFLPAYRKHCQVFECERIQVAGPPRECILHGYNVYLKGTVDDDPRRALRLVADELKLQLEIGQLEAIVQRRTPAEIRERHERIRQCSTDAGRLVAAVGEDRLRERLPKSLLAVLKKECASLEGTEIAEAAIATYHTDALRRYKRALDHLAPPSQWAGSARAVKFVQDLGFSDEWAGERNRRLDPFLEVEGRIRLPELHNYQRIVVRNVRNMLQHGDSASSQRRGLISMPTGSGKTRVTIQAIVEAIQDKDFVGNVLWVADRSELCEQAVEAWRQVWSSIGPHESPLRISRMWDGQQTPRYTSKFHVVVATIQTLNGRLSTHNGNGDFLGDLKLVVFDEAHRSIAPTFTSVMSEIGLTRRQGADEPFLLGLTATPYRGFNREETKWLVNRYGGNRLDDGAFRCSNPQEIIQELQSRGVLAQTDHKTIEGDTFTLDDILETSTSADERKRKLKEWMKLPWLPQNVEDRIAQSTDRTMRIIDACELHIKPQWPTLIFATSVEHAQTVAALLNRKGIRSRAVSAQTEGATRRRVVEEFRNGRIKALVNYGVFREGFDAPKTRAIIVARPVYSPNLYFQMIGRGLRGPLNGGSERCIILNVKDNIETFDRKLAFTELDWLWA
ncbi:MAG: DEAD/DEAH box helicase [Rhodobacteraceae bacterium]|nr:DEAD/DEAH box helicase [Paracoccaceae bacterium]